MLLGRDTDGTEGTERGKRSGMEFKGVKLRGAVKRGEKSGRVRGKGSAGCGGRL